MTRVGFEPTTYGSKSEAGLSSDIIYPGHVVELPRTYGIRLTLRDGTSSLKFGPLGVQVRFCAMAPSITYAARVTLRLERRPPGALEFPARFSSCAGYSRPPLG